MDRFERFMQIQHVSGAMSEKNKPKDRESLS